MAATAGLALFEIAVTEVAVLFAIALTAWLDRFVIPVQLMLQFPNSFQQLIKVTTQLPTNSGVQSHTLALRPFLERPL